MRVLTAALAILLCAPAALAADQPAPPPAAPAADGPPPLPAPEPPPLPATPVEYYVGENGQRVGPMTLEQLEQRIREGKTVREDLVWKTGLAAWQAAQSFAELQPAFQQVQPPALPPEATFKQTLIGTWEASYDMQGYFITSRLAYGADGRYAGTVMATPPGGQPLQSPLYGSWTIKPTGQDTFTLTLKDGSGATSNHQIRIVDPTTLENLGTGVRSRKIAM
jgi:hypothetical protein